MHSPQTPMQTALYVQRRRILLASGMGLLAGKGLNAVPAWAAGVQATRTLKPRPLVFPRDHGSHNETRTEWWYLTGHAQDATGRPFGFQVTFFRSRVDSAQALPGRLAARQLLFAHAAVTDVEGKRLWHDQRISRWNGQPPAPTELERGVFASTQDTHVVLRDWSLQRRSDGSYRAYIQGRLLSMSIHATPTQPLLLQGEQGFSRKGPEVEQASFYVTQPQLQTQARLVFANNDLQVKGIAWLDHEWSEALLHPEAVGWDWIGINLFNGESLTAFRLRRADGSTLWTGGSWRQNMTTTAENAHHSNIDEVAFSPLRHWNSAETGARYPVEWQIDIRLPTTQAASSRPDQTKLFIVKALVDNQELDSRSTTGTVYWEGVSDLFNAQGEHIGRGYLEMTGYAQRLVL